MYQINNTIKLQNYNGLQVSKVVKTEVLEIISISLEKEAIFPEHTSPTDAQLVVLEGDISFHINNETHQLVAQQHFNFPKEMKHSVVANANSKFLIIR
ncbi:hypothetical protein [Maribacter sp.]|uniref:hypothetical protein n=1 Tax=Maribacter sp. TaxID=1897614 RepID=UPI0025BAEF80|nr:hypothetical protein [Maribacter sp.]